MIYMLGRGVGDIYGFLEGGRTFPGLPPRIRITVGESRSTAGKNGSPANCALRNSSWAAA